MERYTTNGILPAEIIGLQLMICKPLGNWLKEITSKILFNVATLRTRSILLNSLFLPTVGELAALAYALNCEDKRKNDP
jgi:hypothetical protein